MCCDNNEDLKRTDQEYLLTNETKVETVETHCQCGQPLDAHSNTECRRIMDARHSGRNVKG